jgi:hypothetical protein
VLNILGRTMTIGVPGRRQSRSVPSTASQSAITGCATSPENVLSALPDRSIASLHALSHRERAKLEGILARLASPYESERATAALFASEFLTKHGLTWSHLVGLLEPTRSAVGAPTGAVRKRDHGGDDKAGGYRARRGSLGQALDVVA